MSVDFVTRLVQNSAVGTAGESRDHLSAILADAYGRGLISERTLAMRLDVVTRAGVIDPEVLIGDLFFRRSCAGFRAGADRLMTTIRRRVDTSYAKRSPATLLGLDWSGACAELLIGRHPHCDIVVDDAEVSRRHARLRFRDGRWVLQDLESTNGSHVNGRAVGRCEVRPGDELSFGASCFRVD